MFGYNDWFEEDDLLTNFTKDELTLYEKTIEKFGDDTLFISDEAFSGQGRKLRDHYSLRTTVHKDRGDFFDLLRRLRKNFKK